MKLSRLFVWGALWLISQSAGAAKLIERYAPYAPSGEIDPWSIDWTPAKFVVGNAYIMFNVGTGMFYYRGNAYQTQASGSDENALLVRFVESDEPGSLWLRNWDDRYNQQRWRTAFITTGDSKAKSIGMEAALFIDNNDGPAALLKVRDLGDNTYRISVSDKNKATTEAGINTFGTYFAIDTDLGYYSDGMGGYVINPIATGGNTEWMFFEVPEWTEYFNAYDVYTKSLELKDFITKAENVGLDVSYAVNVYNYQYSTVEEMDYAITALKEALANNVRPGDHVSDLWFTNCDFANGSQGWIGSSTCNFNAGIAEAYGKDFDIYQDFTPAKKGIYRLNLQGFFRTGRGNTALQNYMNGTQTCDAGVYLGTAESVNKTKLACVFSEQIDPSLLSGHDFSADNGVWNDGNYYANTMGAANVCFNNGMYVAKAYGIVKNEGETVRIGVGGKLGNLDWICWDNFDLIYLGYDNAEANAFLLQQAMDNLNTSRPMGKSVFEKADAAIKNGKDAIASDNATRMFEVLSTIYELYDRVEASVAAFTVLTDALSKLQVLTDNSSNTDAKIDAADFYNGVYAMIAAHQYEEWDIPELLIQIKYHRTKVCLPSNYAEANSTNPIDVTSVIESPTFDNGEGGNSIDGWEANGYNFGNDDYQRSALALEFYNKAFDLNQTIYGLPNGNYVIRVNAFARMDDEKTNPVYFYGISGYNVFMAELADLNSEDGVNDMVSASFAFDEGKYINELVVKVTDETLRIGIKKDTNLNSEIDWVCLDNFQLFYLGSTTPSSPAIAFADTNVKALCVANWDINGDGELSEAEAAAVTDLGTVFNGNTTITSFNELRYFTGLTSIGDYAFQNCSGLTSVTIPNSVTSIGEAAFRYCSGMTSVTIPNSVTSLGDYAFWQCSGLTSVTIPGSVTSIGECAFNGCGLSSIFITDMEAWCRIVYGSNPYSQSYDLYLNGIIVNDLVIPSSVSSIHFDAFYYCRSLKSVTIPSIVTSIGSCAFENCFSLTSVIVERSTPLTIDSYCFSNRTNATLYVPKGSKSTTQSADYWKEFKAIKEYPDGDVNQDGETDVVDVVDIARYVVGTPANTFDVFLADLNSDKAVNVTDAVVLVNEIAGDTNWSRRLEASQVGSNDVLALTENSDHSLSLQLEGDGRYTAFQFDLTLPADIDVMQMRLDNLRKQEHQLLYHRVGEGKWRVAALSTSNDEFKGISGELLNIMLDSFATDDVVIENIHFVTANGTDVPFANIRLSRNGETMAIGNTQFNDDDSKTVYGLNGQRRNAPIKGLNIIGGKKVIIK